MGNNNFLALGQQITHFMVLFQLIKVLIHFIVFISKFIANIYLFMDHDFIFIVKQSYYFIVLCTRCSKIPSLGHLSTFISNNRYCFMSKV